MQRGSWRSCPRIQRFRPRKERRVITVDFLGLKQFPTKELASSLVLFEANPSFENALLFSVEVILKGRDSVEKTSTSQWQSTCMLTVARDLCPKWFLLCQKVKRWFLDPKALYEESKALSFVVGPTECLHPSRCSGGAQGTIFFHIDS